MSDPSVSDVDPDDLEQMIQGIDDIDDNLFGIKKDKSKSQPTKPTMKTPSENPKPVGKKVQFEEEDEPKVNLVSKQEKEDVKPKPTAKKIDFDDEDDDILGSLENKPKSKSTKSVMDDLFGSKESNDKKSFMDDIFGGNKQANKKTAATESKDFVLDSKYKKQGGDIQLGSSDITTNRRRRGNPTVGPTAADDNLVLDDNKKTDSVPKEIATKSNTQDNPFPWMSSNSTSANPASQILNESSFKTPQIQASVKPQLSSVQPVASEIVSSFKPSPMLQTPPNIQASNTQSQVYDSKQQELFNQDMEMQTKLLNDRKTEYAAALERQRCQFTEHFERLHNKQTQVLNICYYV